MNIARGRIIQLAHRLDVSFSCKLLANSVFLLLILLCAHDWVLREKRVLIHIEKFKLEISANCPTIWTNVWIPMFKSITQRFYDFLLLN